MGLKAEARARDGRMWMWMCTFSIIAVAVRADDKESGRVDYMDGSWCLACS